MKFRVWDCKNKKWLLPIYGTNEFMEVIGNIYEMPDLLK